MSLLIEHGGESRNADADPAPLEGGLKNHYVQAEIIVFWTAVLLSLAPLVFDAGRAIRRKWVPFGDDAFVALRVHDVFTSHTPLIGMPAGAFGGPQSGSKVNHLGPLEFWLLAVPYRLSGSSSTGIIIGVLLIVAATVVGIGLVARRLKGTAFGVGALLLTTSIVWAFGSDLAHLPFNPSVVVLPVLLMALLALAIIRGDFVLWPALAFVASFVAQGHLADAPLVVILVLWVIVASRLATRGEPEASKPRPSRRTLLTTLGVTALCWAGPVVDVIVHGFGTISNLWSAGSGSTGGVMGARVGFGYVGEIVATPWGLTTEPATLTVPDDISWSTIAMRLSLATTLAVGLFVLGLRTKRRHLTLTSGTAIILVLSAILIVSRAPNEGRVLGNYIWYTWLLWPVAAGFWLLIILSIVEAIPARLRRAPAAFGRLPAHLALSVLMLLTLLPIAYKAREGRPAFPEASQAAIGEIVAALDKSLPHDAVIRVKFGQFAFLDGLTANAVLGGVIFELSSTDRKLLVDSPTPMLRSLLGFTRLFDGRKVDGTIYMFPAASTGSEPGTLVVRTGLLDGDEQGETLEIERQLRASHARGELVLTEEGRARFEAESLLLDSIEGGPRLTPEAFFESHLTDGTLAPLYRDRAKSRATETRALLKRQSSLRRKTNPSYQFEVRYQPTN